MSNNKKNTTPPVSGDNLSNELLRMVINSSPHITVLFDDKFGVIQCNPAALKFLLFESLPDLISGFAERLMSSVPPHQPDGRPSVPIIERFVTAAKDGVSKFETVLILNDIMHHVSVELIRIFYEKSFVIVAYVIDLTQQNTRELELIKAHELNELHMTKMELMIKSAGIGLWDMEVIKNDPINPANVFNWSDEFRQMIGFTDENDFPNVLSSWSDRLHPDDKEYTLKAFKKHLTDRTGKIPYDVEYRLLKKDWTYSYYHATGETVRDKNGDAIRVAGALMDISEEKQMTEALKDSVDGLERTQKMMHGINTAASFLLNADVDSFESAYLTAMKTIAESVNVDRMYIWKNYIKDEKLHCLQIFEWYKDEKLQHKSIVFDIPYEGNITGWEKLLSEGNCVNEIVKDMSSDEKDLLEKQGIVSILVVPIFIREVFWGFVGLDDCVNERVFSKEEESILRSGSVLLASAWLRNSMVKDLRETSVQLEAALIRAEDANNAKSNFLSTVSHEIRTPMNAILGITEIQLQTESLEEDVRDAFDRIYVSGDLLLGIINDILDLSKIEAD
ncbi:MAG: PAS domain-containing protein, partial [Oscillospiraceae bacterium]|nr:PAS domain-containing protein [Oscillospiraceae bacterium]